MSDIVCPKCYSGNFTRITINPNNAICDNCNFDFTLENAFQSIKTRKFQQLSYLDLCYIFNSVIYYMNSDCVINKNDFEPLKKELEEELEIRG